MNRIRFDGCISARATICADAPSVWADPRSGACGVLLRLNGGGSGLYSSNTVGSCWTERRTSMRWWRGLCRWKRYGWRRLAGRMRLCFSADAGAIARMTEEASGLVERLLAEWDERKGTA